MKNTLKMKNAFLLFVSPVLVLFCSLLSWMIRDGSSVLFIWLFRDLCMPIIHFAIVANFVKKYSFKNGGIITSVLLYLVIMAVNMVIIGNLAKNSRLVLFYSIFNIAWAIICGIIIIGNSVVMQTSLSKMTKGVIVTAEAVVALIINAIFTWTLSPILATSFAIDGIEILLLPLSALFLCLFSYLLGTMLTKKHIALKLFAWFVGVTLSVFVVLWLLGTPHTPPYTDKITTVMWIVSSIIIFAFSFVGILWNKMRYKFDMIEKDMAEKRASL